MFAGGIVHERGTMLGCVRGPSERTIVLKFCKAIEPTRVKAKC